MKTTINKFSILGLLLLGLFSCEKEEDRVTIEYGDAPTLSTSSNNLALVREMADNEAITFSWTELPVQWSDPEVAHDGAVNYILEIDSAGNNFESPVITEMGNELARSYSVREFNEILLEEGFQPETQANIEARIRVTNNIETLYSNVVNIEATPYSTDIEPAYVYVPGAYQGWDPTAAPVLVSFEDNGEYQGIITITDEGEPVREFKITSEPNWEGTNYGESGEGVLSTDGGAGNLSVPEAYTYLITADLNNLSWSAEKHSWAIVGDATGSWDVDQDMTFDNREGVWKITTELVPGKIKFRFNDAWDTNYGDDDTSDSALNAGGADIDVAEAGTYDIILDLSDEANPTYSITKVE
jgi:hypothetical protein